MKSSEYCVTHAGLLEKNAQKEAIKPEPDPTPPTSPEAVESPLVEPVIESKQGPSLKTNEEIKSPDTVKKNETKIVKVDKGELKMTDEKEKSGGDVAQDAPEKKEFKPAPWEKEVKIMEDKKNVSFVSGLALLLSVLALVLIGWAGIADSPYQSDYKTEVEAKFNNMSSRIELIEDKVDKELKKATNGKLDWQVYKLKELESALGFLAMASGELYKNDVNGLKTQIDGLVGKINAAKIAEEVEAAKGDEGKEEKKAEVKEPAKEEKAPVVDEGKKPEAAPKADEGKKPEAAPKTDEGKKTEAAPKADEGKKEPKEEKK